MISQALEKITTLLQGKIPTRFDCSGIDSASDRKFAEALNQLITFMEETHQFVSPLARGQLSDVKWSSKNFLASPFKELHSRLSHLTWQAKQVAGGNYDQRVDFMGEFSEAFNFMIKALDRNERLLKEKIDKLEQALGYIERLEGILPICANCKRIRLEGGEPKSLQSWIRIESYLSTRTDAKISHSICPECMQKLYPEYVDHVDPKKGKG
jgi:soluble cytochrome b562